MLKNLFKKKERAVLAPDPYGLRKTVARSGKGICPYYREWKKHHDKSERPIQRMLNSDLVEPSRFDNKDTMMIFVNWLVVSEGDSEEYFDYYRRADETAYCSISGDYTRFDTKYCTDMWFKANDGHFDEILPATPRYNPDLKTSPMPRYIPAPLNDREYVEYTHIRSPKQCEEFAKARWPKEHRYWEEEPKRQHGKSQKQTKEYNSGTEIKVTRDKKTADRYTKWQNIVNSPSASNSEREFALRRMMAVDESR